VIDQTQGWGGNQNLLLWEPEPSLGALTNDHHQTRWAESGNTDREAGDDNGIADREGAHEQGFGFAI
jgi:hypothetical protein